MATTTSLANSESPAEPASDVPTVQHSGEVTGSGPSGAAGPTVRFPPPTPTPVGPADLKRRGLVAGALAVLTLLLSVGGWFGDVNPWLQAVLATPAVGWAALPFHREAYRGARQLAPTWETPACLAIAVAWLWSLVTLLTGAGAEGTYFFGAAAGVTALLIGTRWLEARGEGEARAGIDDLLDLGPGDVAVQRIDSRTRATTEVRLPLGDLQVGDHFIVRPGEKVAMDGTVVDGTSSLDTSLLTGRDQPEDVRSGDVVHAGTVNTNGRLVVEATAVGEDTSFAAIARIVERSRTGTTELARRVDRLSALLVPTVLGLAVLAFAGWWVGSGSAAEGAGVAIAVLVVASPGVLAVATSLALLAGTSRSAQRGILFAGPQVPEDAAGVDTLVLDKTGTITTAVAEVTDLAAAPGLHPAAVLTAAAAVETGSDHPIARAIIRRAQTQQIKVPRITDFETLPGQGVVASIKGTRVKVGRADLFDDVPAELATLERPGTTVFVGWEGKARGALTVSDEVRDASGDAIRALRAQGLQVWLLTGDNRHHATAVAETVGIDPEHVVADVRHRDKAAAVARLRGQGHVVAMVGDGRHDTEATTGSDLGLALGVDTNLARSARVVLVHGDLDSVPRSFRLGRETIAVAKQNLLWALGYHVVALVLALTGVLGPVVAGLAMTLASAVVVVNSLRLRRATG